ncbi:MAG: tRNA adenosine(34) deaminase TadA [Candidatus Sumerlaeia bacterium]|nr:tRNA adenosine(34) deaminase TadA [Candidatus Sumerlaeia bacterium]
MSDLARAEQWMRLALEEARSAAAADEVPVGAVVVRDNQAIASAHDRKMELRDPTAHAELLALRQAADRLGDWRLDGCEIFVTLEPCAMCAGAILLARIEAVYFGADNVKFGAAGTRIDLFGDHGWNHRVRVVRGMLADECGRLLTDYFRAKRNAERD